MIRNNTMLTGLFFTEVERQLVLHIGRFVDRDMLLRYYWGMGVGHTYAHIKPASAEETHGESTESCVGVNHGPRCKPDSKHTSVSHQHEDTAASGSDIENDSEEWEELHSSGESAMEVSSDEDDILEMYFGSDAGSDLMDIDGYL